MNKDFHLLDDPWLPVTAAPAGATAGKTSISGGRLVSLREVFTDSNLRGLGGSPLEKIAFMKFLLAIAQAAATPEKQADWQALGPEGLAKKCLAYLEDKKDAFWLYEGNSRGQRPFLQFPEIRKALLVRYEKILPEVASDNNTVLTQGQRLPELTDALRARALLVDMSCAFAGKGRVDKTMTLPPGLDKPIARPGPALCSLGLLHSFLTGASLIESLWLNLLTGEDIKKDRTWQGALGTPPWEAMPTGSNDAVAERLKQSLMGRLVPLARFYLLDEEGAHSVQGIDHPGYADGIIDPSTTANFASEDKTKENSGSKNKTKMIWTDPEKRPWRSLTAMLSFLNRGEDNRRKWICPLLGQTIPRLRQIQKQVPFFNLWSGGIRVSTNAGEQYLSGSDDVVESETRLESADMDEKWFRAYSTRMGKLEQYAQALYGATRGYYKEEMADNAEDLAKQASAIFWERAETLNGKLADACGLVEEDEGKAADEVMKKAWGIAHEVYNAACPQDTARQLQHWAEHRPGQKQKDGKSEAPKKRTPKSGASS